MNAENLRAGFAQARAAGKRHKDAARALGVSEGEAIAAHAGTHDMPLKAVPLRASWIEILQALQLCGPLLALTRNESTVHEKTGIYENLSANGHMGLALGDDIDLRLFLGQWHGGFAVTEAAANPGNPPSVSLQFFDSGGLAVHKVYTRDASDRDAFESIMTQFSDPSVTVTFGAPKPAPTARLDAGVDTAALTQAWSTMKDTHEFFMLLKKFDVERQQSFRLMEGRFTQAAPLETVGKLLEEAAFDGTPIMVFVSSPGCIQIHTGPVKRVEPMVFPASEPGAAPARWLNVLDPGFNLHLREDMIDKVWVVEKPTVDGTVTSVEAFDSQGELMVMFFGARKPGVPEREEWRNIVRRLPRLEALSA